MMMRRRRMTMMTNEHNSAWWCTPLDKHVFKGINCATHTLQYQVIGVSCFISSQFLLWVYTRVLYHTVSFFLPTHPPWVILFNVIGWQTVLLGISLTVVYFLFVSLINFSPSQKANCVFFCVRDRSWGIIIKIITVNCLLVTHTLINALFLTRAN